MAIALGRIIGPGWENKLNGPWTTNIILAWLWLMMELYIVQN